MSNILEQIDKAIGAHGKWKGGFKFQVQRVNNHAAV